MKNKPTKDENPSDPVEAWLQGYNQINGPQTRESKLNDLVRLYREKLNLLLSCIEAAEIEGLFEAIRDSSDERLKDLLLRRVFYHLEEVRAAEKKAEEIVG